MVEYIEREKLYDFLTEQLDKETGMYSKGRNNGINVARSALHNRQITPAADVEPVKRGCWSLRCDSREDYSTGEYDEDFYLECSECKRKVWDIDQSLAMSGEWGKLVEQYPYCHCGCKMDGGTHETD